MLTRSIPGTQESLPVIGLGSWQTFDTDSNNSVPRDVLSAFVESGGRLVDSSPMYGKAETAIGNAIESLDLTGKLFVATKVWIGGRAEGIRQMESSLSKLKTRKLDLMQVHNLLDVDTHLETLKDWKQEGRVRYVGVTHYTASAHAAVENVLRKYPVDFLQINYSIAEREAERVLLPLCAERGIGVIVNRPFAEGALFRRLKDRALPGFAQELGCESWAQLALKFIVSHPAVTCVIPATSKPAHLLDYVRGGSGIIADAELRKRIADAAR
jgi:aryl-alcohol dehydrogenase-like predicted oxidoreductase